MKKHFLRLIALLVFASAISSCSVEYRQRHHMGHYRNGDNDHHNGDNNNNGGHDNNGDRH